VLINSKAIKIHQRFSFSSDVVSFPVINNEMTTTSGVSTTTSTSKSTATTSNSGSSSAGQYKSGALTLEWSDAGTYTNFKFMLNTGSGRASSVVNGISDTYIALGFSKDQEMVKKVRQALRG
jgi:hypothetical protein